MVRIGTFDVRIILVDTGIKVDLLFLSTLKELALEPKTFKERTCHWSVLIGAPPMLYAISNSR